MRSIFDNIKLFCEQIDTCEYVVDYANILNLFLEKIGAKERILQYSLSEPNVVLKNIDEQVFDKFQEIIASAVSMFANVKMSKEMFFEMIKNNLKSTNLKTVPLICDAIFVGDASQSTYLPKKSLFVLGASNARMPMYQGDYGTITDAEVAKIKSKQIVSPTIKELNKREKFKLFNLLTNWQNQLCLSYSTVAGGGVESKSEFLTSIQNLFTFDNKILPIQKAENNYLLTERDESFAPYVVGSFLNAIKISNNNQYQNLQNIVSANLNDLIENEKSNFVNDKKFQISNAKQVLFPKNYTSISQIESYFACPFKQFVSYAIDPQEKPKYEIKAYEIGNILHETAQIFVNEYKKSNKDLDIEKLITEIVAKVINKPEYIKIKENNIASKNLIQEAQRLCYAIKNQIESGNYVPFATEWKFDDFMLENGLKVKGFIDRVDVCTNDNSVRIIDYKTGSQSFDFASAYYGTKLQLVCYLKIVADYLKKKPTGAFYMPVRNMFSSTQKSQQSNFMLDGVMLDEDLTRQNYDKEILQNCKSDIIKAKYTKAGVPDSRSLNTSLDSKRFLELQNYCFDIANIATQEMIDGYIVPKPIKDQGGKMPCDYCEFKAICQYNYVTNGYRKMTKKDKHSFEKDNGGSQDE